MPWRSIFVVGSTGFKRWCVPRGQGRGGGHFAFVCRSSKLLPDRCVCTIPHLRTWPWYYSARRCFVCKCELCHVECANTHPVERPCPCRSSVSVFFPPNGGLPWLGTFQSTVLRMIRTWPFSQHSQHGFHCRRNMSKRHVG